MHAVTVSNLWASGGAVRNPLVEPPVGSKFLRQAQGIRKINVYFFFSGFVFLQMTPSAKSDRMK
jgi:hypothetical protein